MEHLKECLKYLPYNLQNMYMNLDENNLGDDVENMRILNESFKYFPSSLLNLSLTLKQNNLGT